MCGGCSPAARGAAGAARWPCSWRSSPRMLRPTYVFTQMKQHRATLIVLGRSFAQHVDRRRNGQQNALATAARNGRSARCRRFASLNEDLDVKFYTFDSDLTPIDLADDKKFDLAKSPTAAKRRSAPRMDDALRREAGHRLAGMILLSDGAQNCALPARRSAANPGPALWPS